MGALDDIRNMEIGALAEAAGLAHQPAKWSSASANELRDWRDAIVSAWKGGRLRTAPQRQERDPAERVVTEAVTDDPTTAWLVFTELQMWEELEENGVFNALTRTYMNPETDDPDDEEVLIDIKTVTENFAIVVLEAVARRLAVQLVTRLRNNT